MTDLPALTVDIESDDFPTDALRVRELRAHQRNVPIIILSAKGDVDDRIAGLSAGADDYLTKPFSFAELLARLHALVRRSTGATEAVLQLRYADLTLDLLSRTVTRAGQTIELQAREFALLEYFLRHPRGMCPETQARSQRCCSVHWSNRPHPDSMTVSVLPHSS